MNTRHIARTFVLMILAGASLTAEAAPMGSTARARAGARIIAAPQTVSVPELPSSVQLSAQDLERGYAVVSLGTSSGRLAVASGDRDASRVTPATKGAITVDSSAKTEKVEIVLHAE